MKPARKPFQIANHTSADCFNCTAHKLLFSHYNYVEWLLLVSVARVFWGISSTCVYTMFSQSAGDIETIHSLTLETDRYVRSQQFNTVRWLLYNAISPSLFVSLSVCLRAYVNHHLKCFYVLLHIPAMYCLLPLNVNFTFSVERFKILSSLFLAPSKSYVYHFQSIIITTLSSLVLLYFSLRNVSSCSFFTVSLSFPDITVVWIARVLK